MKLMAVSEAVYIKSFTSEGHPTTTRVEAPPPLERNTKAPDATPVESPTTTREEPTWTPHVEKGTQTLQLKGSKFAHHILRGGSTPLVESSPSNHK